MTTTTLTARHSYDTIVNINTPAARQCGLNKTRNCCKESDTPHQHRNGQPLYGKAAARLAGHLDAIAADVAALQPPDHSDGFGGQVWRHNEIRKRLRGSALLLYPGVALDCVFGPGGACGGTEAPNWNACSPHCANTILDSGQLQFLKDTAGRIRSYLDDDKLGATSRLLLQAQLDELETAIAEHLVHPQPSMP